MGKFCFIFILRLPVHTRVWRLRAESARLPAFVLTETRNPKARMREALKLKIDHC